MQQSVANTSESHIAYVGLGSNLNDPAQQLAKALHELNALPNTKLVTCSSFYHSAPIGELNQPDFINAVAKLATSFSARQLLSELLVIERMHGRVREKKYAPRTLDLDLLLFDNIIINEPGLIVPHPRMHERAFVLGPLLEIAPNISIPMQGQARNLFEECTDQSFSKITT